MLKISGILAFIVPNSWLTVEGYEAFRGWLLTHFDILEITNVWKIFSDVNHDATMLVARKRAAAIAATGFTRAASDRPLDVKAIGRGQSEAEKLKQIAASQLDDFSHDHTRLPLQAAKASLRSHLRTEGSQRSLIGSRRVAGD